MKELIFATSNPNKIREIAAKLPTGFPKRIITMAEAGFNDEIIEDGLTLEENAMIKARTIYQKTKLDVFGEDSGLEVYALNMDPGVITARYAGPQKDANDNIDKLLSSLQNEEDRRARFRAVICLILDGEEYLFEGIVNGTISKEKKGRGGFGYDPVFMPNGYTETFAELPDEVKLKFSHRTVALNKMVALFNHQHEKK